jgi:hypothetical protein
LHLLRYDCPAAGKLYLSEGTVQNLHLRRDVPDVRVVYDGDVQAPKPLL